ncbi:beta-lactamase family [Cordyceps militaris]|uniref:Beta-lactamase family n=1 Tax=Cordyceps militaris TaxID=73501 RepID=A0A2H4SNU3_CORMI|nr:beta-lactamase family [Cordyceps militaris]
MDYFESAQFDSDAKSLMDRLHVPGLSVAVVHGNKTASKSYGIISVASSKPCTGASLFDIASSSKILTALSIALLVEDRSHPGVTFDTPVADILPDDFVLSEPAYTKQVTIDDMLGHRTGLPSHDHSYFGVNAEQPDDALSVTRNLRHLQLCAPIRSRYIYNNIMYTVATHLVEKETGLSFSDFLDAHVFTPLDMSTSSLQPSRSRRRGLGAHISSGHMWNASKHQYHEFPALECPEGQGAGSIITSATDYLQLVQALLRQQAPISEAVYAGLTKIRSLPNPGSVNTQPLSSPRFYCAGLMTEYYRGHAIIGHNGGVPGFGSRFFFVPSLQIGAVLLGNAIEAATVAVHLQKGLIDSILGPVDGQEASKDLKRVSRDPESSESEPEEAAPQKMPLTAYTGHYWNPGYRGFHIQIRDEKLFIDARDRSFASTLTLHHVSEQTNFLAYAQAADNMGGMPVLDEPLRAEFVFDNDKAVKFGLLLDPDLDLIWFDRIHAEATPYVFV